MWRGKPGDFCIINGVLHIFNNGKGYVPTDVFQLKWDIGIADGPLPSHICGVETENKRRIKKVIIDPIFTWRRIR